MTDEPGAYRWSLRVRSTGPDAATVTARQHQFVVGAPATFDEQHERVSALEYAFGAVAAELANGLYGLMRDRRRDVDGIEAVIEGELDDPLAYLGVVGATGRPQLRRLVVKLFVSSLDDPPVVEALLDEVLARSPLISTLREAADVHVLLDVTL